MKKRYHLFYVQSHFFFYKKNDKILRDNVLMMLI